MRQDDWVLEMRIRCHFWLARFAERHQHDDEAERQIDLMVELIRERSPAARAYVESRQMPARRAA